MIRNIVFDLGGVVAEYDPRDFLKKHHIEGALQDSVFQATFGSPAWAEMDLGNLSRSEGNRRMLENAAKTGCAAGAQLVVDEWKSIFQTKTTTTEIMSRLKAAGYSLYFLSNIPEDTLAMLKERPFFSLFEDGVPSYAVHINKPDPRIFDALLQRCHLRAAESVFVDDTPANVRTANQLGFTGIHYEDPTSFLLALAQNGVVPASAG